MSEFRIETDSMGEVRLPAAAYYGAQTRRAVENFPISGKPLPRELIHALGLVKYAAAKANHDLGKLTGSGKNRLNEKQVEAILKACREVADGRFDDEFPVDVYQTGSGTSSNMNAN
jgi:fumarate hydratase class II